MLFDELTQLASLATPQEWFSTLKAFSVRAGYSRILFGLKGSVVTDNAKALIYSDYPERWRKSYDENSYASIDPVVKHCLSSNRPLVWRREDYRSPVEAAFFEEAAYYGFNTGLALPLHGARGQAGMLCCQPDDTGTDVEQVIMHSLPLMTLLRDFALEGAERICTEPDPGVVHLTCRERQVLQWSAAGKTTWEIAMIQSCSTAAVDFHFKNIRRKFQVSSRQAAIVKAIQQRLISP